jgi:hypothetical protein
MCPAASYEISFVGEDDSEYFRRVHNRTLNTMNTRYMLPVDADEVRVRYPDSVRNIAHGLNPQGLAIHAIIARRDTPSDAPVLVRREESRRTGEGDTSVAWRSTESS